MSYQDRKQEKKDEEKKFKPLEEEEKGKKCPKCGAINELEAKFCDECGYNFSGERHCPKCGAKILSPNADICEVCGEWLLEGKCKFCYADLEEGATYCSKCGNPVAGIVCPKCGTLSYFDFCPHCNTPLTENAKKTLEEVKNDPTKKTFLDAFRNYEQDLIDSEEKLNEILYETRDITFSSNQQARSFFMALIPPERAERSEKEKIVTEKDELLKIKSYIENVEKKENKKKTFTPLFSAIQKESIKEIDKMADEEIRQQEEERLIKEEERKRKEEEKKRKIKGWVCNAFGVFHPEGPCECADPSKGGYWVIKEA